MGRNGGRGGACGVTGEIRGEGLWSREGWSEGCPNHRLNAYTKILSYLRSFGILHS